MGGTDEKTQAKRRREREQTAWKRGKRLCKLLSAYVVLTSDKVNSTSMTFSSCFPSWFYSDYVSLIEMFRFNFRLLEVCHVKLCCESSIHMNHNES